MDVRGQERRAYTPLERVDGRSCNSKNLWTFCLPHLDNCRFSLTFRYYYSLFPLCTVPIGSRARVVQYLFVLICTFFIFFKFFSCELDFFSVEHGVEVGVGGTRLIISSLSSVQLSSFQFNSNSIPILISANPERRTTSGSSE